MGKKIAPLRVVVDTNVLISALLFGGQPGRLHEMWVGGRLIPLLSRESFAEFSKTLTYPKFRLTPAEVALLVEQELLPYAEVVDATVDATGVCRDEHDDKFLALAASGGASYLITGDRDLLVLKTFGNTQIVTVREILDLM